VNILVTGSSGFLGSNMVKRLQAGNVGTIFCSSQSSGIKANLADPVAVNRLVSLCEPDIVFHFGGCPTVKINDNYPNQLIDANISGTHNLLRAIERGRKKCSFIFSSSVTVYGKSCKSRPLSSRIGKNPISLYGITKLACEKLVYNYHTDKVIDGISVELPALAGIGNTHGLIADLLKKISSDEDSIELFGKCPGSIKPYCHIEEVCKFLYDLVFIGTSCPINKDRTILYGNRDSMTVEEIAQTMMSILGEKKIRWSGKTWRGDNNQIWLDPDISGESSYNNIKKIAEEYKNSELY